MIKIAPSILSANFAHMGDSVAQLSAWGADLVHFDVMDGHFVPNITFGPKMCKDIRPLTKLPLDVHLMVSDPARWILPFSQAGADLMTIHVEANGDLGGILSDIRKLGVKGGLVINPETAVERAFPYLTLCDIVLIMGVHPGFGGQKFISETPGKIRALRLELDRIGSSALLEVDGGINADTARLCIESGANVLVAGNYVFSTPDPAVAIRSLRGRTD